MLDKNANIEVDVQLFETTLGNYVEVKAHSILNHVSMDDYSYCAGYNQIDYAKIRKFCSIASNVRINPGNHPTYTRIALHHFTYRSDLYGLGESDAAFFEWRKKNQVEIGHDVWIGHHAIIMPGVKIGNGAVIGAGAIVTKDVIPYSMVVGVPAKVIKMRFDHELIAKIEKSEWWNWDHDTLRERLDDFRNLDEFVRKYL